ncbi:hypothetical protein Tco_1348891 [Tanacetum coccineum]
MQMASMHQSQDEMETKWGLAVESRRLSHEGRVSWSSGWWEWRVGFRLLGDIPITHEDTGQVFQTGLSARCLYHGEVCKVLSRVDSSSCSGWNSRPRFLRSSPRVPEAELKLDGNVAMKVADESVTLSRVTLTVRDCSKQGRRY